MVQITEENAESQYSFATRMIRVLKCSMMLIFVLISLYSYWTANGKIEAPRLVVFALDPGNYFCSSNLHDHKKFERSKKPSLS